MISRSLIEILICCLYNLCYTINYNVQHGNDMEGTSTISLHTERISPEMLNGYPPEYAVIGRQSERALFQTFHIQYHTAVLSMEELHGSPASVYEDEDIAQSHPVVNHSAQRIDSLAHVCLSATQEITHGIIQTEHGRIICVSIQMSVQGFHGCQGGS